VACLLAAVLTACGAGSSGQQAATPPAPTSKGVVPAVLQPSTAAPKPPVMKEFAPYDEAGRATVGSDPGGSGSCFATSIAVPVSGVYRCLVGNTILDPCFASVHESTPPQVACFADPWSRGALITLTARLPAYQPVLQQGNAWAIELADGSRCVSVTGAVPVLGDVDLSYRCSGGHVAGATENDDGTVTAHYGTSSGPLADISVVVEWRGRSYRLAGAP
jgi:hypothetical protein